MSHHPINEQNRKLKIKAILSDPTTNLGKGQYQGGSVTSCLKLPIVSLEVSSSLLVPHTATDQVLFHTIPHRCKALLGGRFDPSMKV
jgi:hypothetical protein